METEFEQCLNKMRSTLFDVDAREVTRIQLKLISNLLLNPGAEKFRVIKPSNKTISRLLNIYIDFMDYLMLVGFKPNLENDKEVTYVLLTTEEDPARVETGLKILKKTATDLGLSHENIPTVSKYAKTTKAERPKEAKADFDFFKSSSTTTNSMTPAKGDGNSLLEKKVEQLALERKNKMLEAGTPDRRLKVYPLMKNFNPRNFNNISADNDGDETSNTEEKETQQLQMEAGRAMHERYEKSLNFKTKAMREFDSLKNKKVYTEVVFRINLPNRWTIEIFMSPLETLDDLRKILIDQVFVREVFDAISEPLYFYVTPPKKVFLPDDMEKSIDELRLAPAALIYLGFGTVDAKGRVAKSEGKSVDIEQLIRKEVVLNPGPDEIKIPKGQHLSVKDGREGSKKNKGKGFKTPKWMKL